MTEQIQFPLLYSGRKYWGTNKILIPYLLIDLQGENTYPPLPWEFCFECLNSAFYLCQQNIWCTHMQQSRLHWFLKCLHLVKKTRLFFFVCFFSLIPSWVCSLLKWMWQSECELLLDRCHPLTTSNTWNYFIFLLWIMLVNKIK